MRHAHATRHVTRGAAGSVGCVPIRVVSWNLFHGRSQPPQRANLLPTFAGALAAEPWDVCALQEVPPWWPAELGRRLGASVRTTRTSLLRASCPGAQEQIHRRDPERIGVRGAGVNALLVRPAAGEIIAHRAARLRRVPQRRTMHAAALLQPGGDVIWFVNLHTHNRPESQAALDTLLALRLARSWAAGRQGTSGQPEDRVVVAGDLNLKVPAGLVRLEGFDHLHGRHVDHILGRGVRLAGDAVATRVHAWPGGPALSDHRLIGATLGAAALG